MLLIPVLLAAPPVPPRKVAAAQAAETSGGDVKKAKELFQWAQKLYKQARYAEAISKFEDAYAVRPHPVIFFNIGKCYEQLGETAKALRGYRDYLRLAPDASDKETVSDAIANLERRLREKGVQQLMVFSDPPTARISVDGKDLGTSPASVELVAGNHSLVVSADGFEKVTRSFVMQTTRATEMTITLRPIGKDSTPPLISDAPRVENPTTLETSGSVTNPAVVSTTTEAKKGHVWTYVAGGVAVASLGAAVGLGVGANSAADDMRSRERPQVEAQALHDQAQTLATGANVSYGVAAVAAATAIVLFFVEK